MNAEIKQQWIEALRSGKYKQGKGALRSYDDEFCCLGVLCQTSDPDGWVELDLREGFSHGNASGLPSRRLLDSAGLSRAQATRLAQMNDLGNATFTEIADYIEANL